MKSVFMYRVVSFSLMMFVSLMAICLCPRITSAADEPAVPTFTLVGVGPGDPDLITIRALNAMKEADLVFCTPGIEERFGEYLEGKEIVHGYWRLFPYYGTDPATLEGAEREECEALAAKRDEFIGMVRKAVADKRKIAVLDNGDPLIYGPWAWCLEEFEDLKPVVVPGVSCFNAANAALCRSITSSEKTKAVILSSTDWPGMTDTIDKLSVHGSTMALFTMKAEFRSFIDKLLVNYPKETPVAVVVQAGYSDGEQVIEGTLGTIAEKIEGRDLPFEYMIYVGEFLTFRNKTSEADSKQPAVSK